MLHWILTIKFYVDFAIRNNNNVDINFSVYDVFLESPSSGTQSRKIGKANNTKNPWKQ